MRFLKYVVVLSVVLLTYYRPAFAQTHTVVWDSSTHQKTVEEWSRSLDKISDVSSTSYIKKKLGGRDKFHRNGHRDVIIWIPETTDLTEDFVVVMWFHGHWGYVPTRTFEDRTLKQLVPLTDSKNFVLVIPEMPWSVHTKTPTKRNSLLWQKSGDFIKFVNQVESVLLTHAKKGVRDDAGSKKSLGAIDYRIVGHSAGGSTIKRLGITGDLCSLNPSLVVWSDSSYGPWLSLAWDGCLKNHRDILVKVFVAKGDSPWWRATQFMGQFQTPPKNLELHVMKKPAWSHKLIGDNVVKLSKLLE